MSGHPLKDAIATSVAHKAELHIPIPKYTVLVSLTGNTRDEINRLIHSLYMNWDYEYGDRDEIDSTDGTTTILMQHTNPDQTPERYTEQLLAWRDERRSMEATR